MNACVDEVKVDYPLRVIFVEAVFIQIVAKLPLFQDEKALLNKHLRPIFEMPYLPPHKESRALL